ncbi:MAG: hypothetical protein LPD71_01275 [Shewanella sp.]|nr:hypothetical protein [Shewanella sp.]MCF1429662.1 hypothetical protein [Shewanella sp.]MCF1437416.1 hypothetical protein [Shewanella sp.]MCF1456296.1 hypothetical protein [Shewanella sp.]
MSATRIGSVLGTILLALGGCHAQNDAQPPAKQPDQTESTRIRQVEVDVGAHQALAKSGQKSHVGEKAVMVKETTLTGYLQVSDKPSARGLTVIQLLVTNPQSYGVPMQFNSGMTGDLWLMAANGERLWAWSDDMMFTQALRNLTLASGKTMTVNFDIPAKVMERARQGDYWQARLMAHNSESTKPLLMPQILPVQ